MAKRSGKFYRKNEREVMQEHGLKGTKGSGAFWLEKEDGQNDYVIAQLKSTDAQSMKLNLQDIETLEYNAIVAHKIPVFMIQFLQTNDIYIMAKPSDIPALAEYMEFGSCNINSASIVEDLLDVEETKIAKPKKVISSGNREKFWKEKQKEREKWNKK